MKYLPYKIFLLTLIAVGYFAFTGLAAEPDYLFQVQSGLHLPEQGSMLFAGQADLSGNGFDKWVFAIDNTVRIYELNDGVFRLWQEVTFEATVSAIHLADLDGDDVYEVIVAYDDIGILDVIGWSAGEFWKSYSRVYLWSKVSSLDSLKLSGFPFRLILATTEDGSLTIFRWNGVNPETLWTANHLRGSHINYIGSGDFDLDGESDFALVVNRAELQIYSPGKSQQLKPVWTNFPWGGISSSYLVDLDNDRAEELVVASPAGLLSAFEWYRGSYIDKWKYEEVPGIIRQLTYLILPQSQRPALAGEIRGNLLIWPLSKSGAPQPHSTVRINHSEWKLTDSTQDSFFGWDVHGVGLKLVEYQAEEIQLYFHQKGVSFAELDFLINRGEVWIPLRQLASLFGMSLDYDPISGMAYLSAETIFMVFNDSDQVVYVNSIPVKVSGGLRKINGLFALSLPLAESMFNFTTHWLKETAYLFPN